MNTKNIIITSFFATFICIFSVFSIPVGVIPVSLSLFAVFLTAIVLDLKKAVTSILIYILCGSIGIPVFSGFQGGLQVLFGPGGGYIIGYIFIAAIMGFISYKTTHINYIKRYTILFISAFLSLAFCYTSGTLQYAFISKLSFGSAVKICVYPFVFFDFLKIFLAILSGEILRKRITQKYL